MAWGLPKLPGLTFSDPTKTKHHMRSSLRYYQGYRFPDTTVKGPGGSATDVESNAFALPEDPVNYDPSLTYGRVKQAALPAVIPHWVHYDKRCLSFTAFLKEPVFESPNEKYRVRVANIVYFLEDDSLTVIEPRTRNSGLWQGRLVKRGKIPKNDLGNVGIGKTWTTARIFASMAKSSIRCPVIFYEEGVLEIEVQAKRLKSYATSQSGEAVKEWLESQGIELSKEEDLPVDPYTEKEHWKKIQPPRRTTHHDDPLLRFLEYDGKVLAFNVVWDNRDSVNGELTEYKLFYFLQDDSISVKEIHDGRGGKDPFPLLLKKMKLPKKWKEKPVSFPSIVMETSEEEVTEYYCPRDLIVGETIFVLGRRVLIYDCDPFTRKYYKVMLNIDQPARVEIPRKEMKDFPRVFPPHIGIGTPEDSLGSCFGLTPKPPHKDVIKYNLNANKYLRYLCELDWIHPEDKGRQFILSYSLADGTIKIGEVPKRNSGIREGKFLKAMLLQTPESDPNFPTYYTPDKFYVGGIVPVFKHRFKITGCDLFVYRYMSANPEKFPQEVIDNVRNYHMKEGNLKDELEEALKDLQASEMRAQLAKIGQAAVAEPDAMERCLSELGVVEGSATPPRAPSPPKTTDHISYDDALRMSRLSKPTCDNVLPLKGILKSGEAREDHQKVVCFSGPSTEVQHKPSAEYPQRSEHPQFDEDPNFCDKYKDSDAAERAERRARNECPYEISPSAQMIQSVDDSAKKTTGYLGKFGVECKEVPDYMRLPRDAYEKVKKLRQDVPKISPQAERLAGLPREDFPPVGSCLEDKVQERPCSEGEKEDVAFSCPRVEPGLPCCDPGKRDSP